jgi:hypothetical protein
MTKVQQGGGKKKNPGRKEKSRQQFSEETGQQKQGEADAD